MVFLRGDKMTKTEKRHQAMLQAFRTVNKDPGYLPDTRPERHDGDVIATERVLKDMAVEDALDEMDI